MRKGSRREFLADVGRGMLLGSFGMALFEDLQLGPLYAGDDVERLTFGALEPLVALMQETPLAKLQPQVVEKIQAGTDLKTLIAAAALANARTFGGQDYVGFHTIMALAPAYQMSQELASPLQALPVLKVLYRNTDRIQQFGGVKKEVLKPVKPASRPEGRKPGEWLREATLSGDYDQAEQVFAALAQGPRGEAYNHLQFAVQEETNVHRVVLAWRAWAMIDFTGAEHAHSLLRQSVRYCVKEEIERKQRQRPEPQIRRLLPRLLDEHKLLSRSLGNRKGDDGWVEELAKTVFASERDQAAEAVAIALAEGFDPESVGEALSIAANMLLLHDPGQSKSQGAERPAGSVHGASVGVHASDAANAWRNIARVSNQRNCVASLVAGGYHTAGQQGNVGDQAWPLAAHLEAITTDDPTSLLETAEAAIRDRDQGRAAAAIQRYSEGGHDSQAVFGLLLRFATTQDGALHAEKYYRTVVDEFQSIRPAFRWRQLVALARVTASENGWKAPGLDQACDLLKVKV